MEQVIPFLLLAVVFYLLIFRPMRARQKEFAALKELQDSVQPGAKIMMASGIFGTVREVNKEEIVLEIAPNTNIVIARGAVAVINTDAKKMQED